MLTNRNNICIAAPSVVLDYSKRLFPFSLAALTLLLASAAHSQPYVNVTVGGEFSPGVYGQIAVGTNPPPPVINPQPVIVGTPVYGAQPVYIHVPEDEREHWERHCYRYDACGRPVHFVRVEERNRWWERRAEEQREYEYRREEERRFEERSERRHHEEERRYEGRGERRNRREDD